MNKRVKEIADMISKSPGMWYDSILKVLGDLPEFQLSTWNDPKVSQPKLGRYIALSYGNYATVEMRSTQDVTCPWHYITIAPIPEPESELVKYLKDKMDKFNSMAECDKADVIDAIKKFESKK